MSDGSDETPEFEKWAVSRPDLPLQKHEFGRYDSERACAREAWQAARETPARPQKPCVVCSRVHDPANNCEDVRMETPARPQSAEQWLELRGLADLSLYWPTGKPLPKPTLIQLMQAYAVELGRPQSAELRGQEMTFDQWYGNRPANRKQASREVWYAALAHAPELASLRAELDDNNLAFEHANEIIGKYEKDLNSVRSELGVIDMVLARRPALADLSDRYAKIERACTVAGRAEKAEAECDGLRDALQELIVEVQAHNHPDIECLKQSLVKAQTALAALLNVDRNVLAAPARKK